MDNIADPEFQVVPKTTHRRRGKNADRPPAEVVLSKHKLLATIIRRDEGFDGMPIEQQLKATESVLNKQIGHAALILATHNIEDVSKDPVEREQYKIKVEYLKDFILISEKLSKLSVRIEEDAGAPVITEVYDEANDLLAAADDLLRLKGVK
jgi:ATP-dependent RNA circularization protein (DNA/RNA ligase family)